ncbi:Uncharacterised protein g6238 [Pycnogonum litorale]
MLKRQVQRSNEPDSQFDEGYIYRKMIADCVTRKPVVRLQKLQDEEIKSFTTEASHSQDTSLSGNFTAINRNMPSDTKRIEDEDGSKILDREDETRDVNFKCDSDGFMCVISEVRGDAVDVFNQKKQTHILEDIAETNETPSFRNNNDGEDMDDTSNRNLMRFQPDYDLSENELIIDTNDSVDDRSDCEEKSNDKNVKEPTMQSSPESLKRSRQSCVKGNVYTSVEDLVPFFKSYKVSHGNRQDENRSHDAIPKLVIKQTHRLKSSEKFEDGNKPVSNRSVGVRIKKEHKRRKNSADIPSDGSSSQRKSGEASRPKKRKLSDSEKNQRDQLLYQLPDKRLEAELPGWNWLENKIKKSSLHLGRGNESTAYEDNVSGCDRKQSKNNSKSEKSSAKNNKNLKAKKESPGNAKKNHKVPLKCDNTGESGNNPKRHVPKLPECPVDQKVSNSSQSLSPCEEKTKFKNTRNISELYFRKNVENSAPQSYHGQSVDVNRNLIEINHEIRSTVNEVLKDVIERVVHLEDIQQPASMMLVEMEEELADKVEIPRNVHEELHDSDNKLSKEDMKLNYDAQVNAQCKPNNILIKSGSQQINDVNAIPNRPWSQPLTGVTSVPQIQLSGDSVSADNKVSPALRNNTCQIPQQSSIRSIYHPAFLNHEKYLSSRHLSPTLHWPYEQFRPSAANQLAVNSFMNHDFVNEMNLSNSLSRSPAIVQTTPQVVNTVGVIQNTANCLPASAKKHETILKNDTRVEQVSRNVTDNMHLQINSNKDVQRDPKLDDQVFEFNNADDEDLIVNVDESPEAYEASYTKPEHRPSTAQNSHAGSTQSIGSNILSLSPVCSRTQAKGVSIADKPREFSAENMESLNAHHTRNKMIDFPAFDKRYATVMQPNSFSTDCANVTRSIGVQEDFAKINQNTSITFDKAEERKRQPQRHDKISFSPNIEATFLPHKPVVTEPHLTSSQRGQEQVTNFNFINEPRTVNVFGNRRPFTDPNLNVNVGMKFGFAPSSSSATRTGEKLITSELHSPSLNIPKQPTSDPGRPLTSKSVMSSVYRPPCQTPFNNTVNQENMQHLDHYSNSRMHRACKTVAQRLKEQRASQYVPNVCVVPGMGNIQSAHPAGCNVNTRVIMPPTSTSVSQFSPGPRFENTHTGNIEQVQRIDWRRYENNLRNFQVGNGGARIGHMPTGVNSSNNEIHHGSHQIPVTTSMMSSPQNSFANIPTPNACDQISTSKGCVPMYDAVGRITVNKKPISNLNPFNQPAVRKNCFSDEVTILEARLKGKSPENKDVAASINRKVNMIAKKNQGKTIETELQEFKRELNWLEQLARKRDDEKRKIMRLHEERLSVLEKLERRQRHYQAFQLLASPSPNKITSAPEKMCPESRSAQTCRRSEIMCNESTCNSNSLHSKFTQSPRKFDAKPDASHLTIGNHSSVASLAQKQKSNFTVAGMKTKPPSNTDTVTKQISSPAASVRSEASDVNYTFVNQFRRPSKGSLGEYFQPVGPPAPVQSPVPAFNEAYSNMLHGVVNQRLRESTRPYLASSRDINQVHQSPAVQHNVARRSTPVADWQMHQQLACHPNTNQVSFVQGQVNMSPNKHKVGSKVYPVHSQSQAPASNLLTTHPPETGHFHVERTNRSAASQLKEAPPMEFANYEKQMLDHMNHRNSQFNYQNEMNPSPHRLGLMAPYSSDPMAMNPNESFKKSASIPSFYPLPEIRNVSTGFQPLPRPHVFTNDSPDISACINPMNASMPVSQAKLANIEQYARQCRLQNENSAARKSAIGPRNLRCNKCNSKAIFICSGCKNAAYCSPLCQKLDWSEHTTKCRSGVLYP